MTHIELLERLNAEVKAAEFEDACGDGGWPQGIKALRAIVQLHQQLEDNSCHHCVTWYPCSTIQAVEKELS